MTQVENGHLNATLTPNLAEPKTVNPEIKKILVAIDKVSAAEVFGKALLVAKALNSNLLIFHCITEPNPTTSTVLAASSVGIYGGAYAPEMFNFSRKVLQEEREKLLVWLYSFYEQATTAGLMAEYNYKEGDAGHQICEVAHQWDADLVIVGRRGRSGLSEILLGSVSNYVLHHAHCAVMVVQ